MKRLRLLALLLVFASCAPRVPFTQQIREEYKLTEDELKSIQFYVSHNIVLKRGEKMDKQKATEDGALKIKSGQSVEGIVIKAGTRGVVEKVVDGNRLAISFEVGDNTYLVFGEGKSMNGYYTLQATEWKDGRGTINYGDQLYMSNAGSGSIYLLFKLKKLDQYRKKQKIVKGRKV